MGRPTIYNAARHLSWAETLAMEGKTNAEIAGTMGIGLATLKAWRNRHPAFKAALMRGKSEPDCKVERSLYERAIGYTYSATKVVRQIRKEKGEDDVSTITETQQEFHMPPDVTAQIFWLKNRNTTDWRDNPADSRRKDSQVGIREWLEATAITPRQVAALFIEDTEMYEPDDDEPEDAQEAETGA